jgi:hypothetical protein
VWEVRAQGGNCVTRPGILTALLAKPISLRLNERVHVDIYRSPVIPVGNHLFPSDPLPGKPTLQQISGSNVYQMANAAAPLRVNLYWTLTDLAVTPVASPGNWVTIAQAWRIDALPDEPYAHWYFTPYVTLSMAGGQALSVVNSAPTLEGWQWRTGDTILSAVRVQVPPDTSPGGYKLKISLFDPNQKKNAVFFSPDAPDKPIIELERSLTVDRAP